MFQPISAFAGFSTNDVPKTKQFYSETLGLDVVESKEGLEITLPNSAKLFIYPKPNHEPATFTVLNFIVANIDDAVIALKEKGITFEMYEGMHQDEDGIARGLATGDGPSIAWFKDPAGNILSVLQAA